jgi:hypothetical protein
MEIEIELSAQPILLFSLSVSLSHSLSFFYYFPLSPFIPSHRTASELELELELIFIFFFTMHLKIKFKIIKIKIIAALYLPLLPSMLSTHRIASHRNHIAFATTVLHRPSPVPIIPSRFIHSDPNPYDCRPVTGTAAAAVTAASANLKCCCSTNIGSFIAYVSLFII